jgi:hypothetical protein
MYVYMSVYNMYEPVLLYQQLASSLYVSSAVSVYGLHRWITMNVYRNLLRDFCYFDRSYWHVLFIVYKGWIAVICQRDAVKLWPQFSAPTPLVWESWTWVPMICRIQEWSCSLLNWGVHTVHWKLSGQFYSMCKQLQINVQSQTYITQLISQYLLWPHSCLSYHIKATPCCWGGYSNPSICLQIFNYKYKPKIYR